MVVVNGRLEIHLTHDCNLRCHGCNHFSNVTRGGMLDPVSFQKQLTPWSRRIVPKGLSLLGGEPTLNPHLTNIVRLARQIMPVIPIMMVTNGLRLDKHPGLPETLANAQIFVLISLHDDPATNPKQAALLDLVARWRRMGVKISTSPSWKNWIESFKGSGQSMLPTGDGDSFKAWHTCPAAQYKCFQLHDGLIWKCPLVAYLPIVKKKFPLLSKRWDPVLQYKALAPTATDDEIRAFYGKREENVCGLCPSSPMPQTC